MSKIRNFSALLFVLTLAAFVLPDNAFAVPRRPILLIVPARHRPLQVAFDMQKFRTTSLVAYERDPASQDLALHMWHDASERWVMLSIDDLRHGDFLLLPPRAVFIIGENDPPPHALVDAAAQWENVTVLESMQVDDMVNAFRKAYRFKRRQWYWLRDRYGFEINDMNEAVRKFNPYSIPASQLPRPIPEIEYDETSDIPPAVIEIRD